VLTPSAAPAPVVVPMTPDPAPVAPAGDPSELTPDPAPAAADPAATTPVATN